MKHLRNIGRVALLLIAAVLLLATPAVSAAACGRRRGNDGLGHRLDPARPPVARYAGRGRLPVLVR